MAKRKTKAEKEAAAKAKKGAAKAKTPAVVPPEHQPEGDNPEHQGKTEEPGPPETVLSNEQPAGDPPAETEGDKTEFSTDVQPQGGDNIPEEANAPTGPTEDAPPEQKAPETAPVPTRPAAVGKKPSNCRDLEGIRLIVRGVTEKKGVKLVVFACMPVDFGPWKLGKEGQENPLGTYLLVDKDTGERGSISAKDFDENLEWVDGDQMYSCSPGRVPK